VVQAPGQGARGTPRCGLVRRRRWLTALAALVMAQLAIIVIYQRLDPDGSRQTMSPRSDRFRLVHFWATWCPSCIRDLRPTRFIPH
jgi:thiol-disulfide isomerase/thioredoxin